MKGYATEGIRNVCLIGSQGDGKTSIAETLLFNAKATTRLGTIAEGNTVCDYSPEEIESCRRNFDNMTQPYKRIRKLGGVMAIGTDSGATTLVRMYSSSAVELELLVKHCDFTPMEAIVAATKNGALASFIGDKTGTIEPGKFADIIIVDGDPLKDIKILQDTNKIKMVMLEGKVEIERSLTPKIV